MPIFRFFFRLFTRKKHRKSFFVTLHTLPGLVTYYSLGDAKGTTALDSSGNDYHATMMGESDAQ